MKIDESSQYFQRKSSYLLKDLKNFNDSMKFSGNLWLMKVTKKQNFTLSLEEIFGKTTGESVFY